jgi:hypothetical protein
MVWVEKAWIMLVIADKVVTSSSAVDSRGDE